MTAPAAPPGGLGPALRGALRLLGPRALAFFGLHAFGSFALAAVEVAVAAVLELFIEALGVLRLDAAPSGLGRLRGLSLAQLALAISAVALVRGGGQFLSSYGVSSTFAAVNARLRRLALYEMLLHPSRRFVPASAVNVLLGETFPKAAAFAYAASNVLALAVQALALLGAMASFAWRQTLLGLAALTAVGLFVDRLNVRTRAYARRLGPEQEALARGIERVARNGVLVRVLRTERREHARLAGAVDRYARHQARAAAFGAIASAATPFFGVALLMAIVVFSARRLGTPGTTLLAFLYLFVRLVQVLTSLVNALSQAYQHAPMMADALGYAARFSDDDLAAARAAAPAEGEAPWPVEGPASFGGPPEIVVESVDFRYPGAERDVLGGVSLRVPPGAHVAVVGPSGGGKSTLLALVLGLAEPSRGRVRVGGRPAAEYVGDRAARVGYVGAEPFLVAGSLRDNLVYGVKGPIGDDAVEGALARAGLGGLVAGLPGGLDYPIAEDGSGLSAGQKQRLCLARALLGRPRLLVLDEASANLDEGTEREIAASIASLRGEATALIVSHRPGMVRHADRVYRLEGGRLGPLEGAEAGARAGGEAASADEAAARGRDGARTTEGALARARDEASAAEGAVPPGAPP
ncbi:MAG TPA: ABC transporter ATP-binding protein [Polyangiaceae bacterium]|nr:ABC transporter ATP-binding protein [Polyangiaceae bacterium]